MDIKYKIIVELYYWKDKLKVPNFLLGIDNKTEYVGYVLYNKEARMPILYLNFKTLKESPELEIIGDLIHELGHIKYKTYIPTHKKGFTEAESIRSEYLAESFALKQIKKYFAAQKDAYIKSWKFSVNDKVWAKSNPIHVKAFSQIKDYKEDKNE